MLYKMSTDGVVKVTPGNEVVKAGGNFIILANDKMTITDCKYKLQSGQSSPCTTIEWTEVAQKRKINGTSVLL
jgi:hypothetical protein